MNIKLTKEEKTKRQEERRIKKWNECHKLIDNIDNKLCNTCNEFYPANEEYFYPNKLNGIDGLYPYCIKCSIKRAKEYRINYDNREKRLETQKRYNKKKETKEYQNKMRKEGYRKEYFSEWQQNNKEKIKEYNDNRKHKNHKISKTEWGACKEYFNNECAYCGLHIDDHFRIYAGKPQKIDFHKEHADDNGKNDLSNCIPSCLICNSSKNTSELDGWYNTDNEKFTLERFNKIIKWLNEDYKQYIKN